MLTGDTHTTMKNPMPVAIAGIQGSLPVTVVADSGYVATTGGAVLGTAAAVLRPAVADKRHTVSALHLANSSLTGVELQLLADAAVVYRMWLPPSWAGHLPFPDRLELPAGAALGIRSAAAGSYWACAVGATR